MDYQPAISVALEDRNGPLVVIDLALALSPLGLLTTMRLAGDVQVMLLPCLWRRLDGWSVERLHPGLAKRIRGRATADDATQTGLANVMAQWESARLELFKRRVYWIAERPDEASLPKDVDPEVIPRFDLRLAGLATSAPPGVEAGIEAGELDALALAAALEPRASAIMTLCESDGEPPRLVQAAAELGASCQRLDAASARYVCLAWWWSMLVRSGLVELVMTGGLRLAFVRLIAPAALYLEIDSEVDQRPPAWLTGAHVLWSPCHGNDA
jgi:hypothetical protein